MNNALEACFVKVFPPEKWTKLIVVAGVSGGSDSIALLTLLTQTNPLAAASLRVVHVNHQLRGQDSEEDAAFVARFCRELGIPCDVRLGPVPDGNRDGQGIEAAARSVRYKILLEAAEQWGARYVLTAHTADDQAETILYRVFRGTGLRGLKGIPRSRPFGPASLCRPLLDFERQDLQQYLDDLGVPYRHDRSNESLDYARNRIRHVILPAAMEVHPGAKAAIVRLASTVEEVDAFLARQVQSAIEACLVSRKPNAVALDRRALAKVDPFLLPELILEIWWIQDWPLRKMSQKNLLRLRDFIQNAQFAQDNKPIHTAGGIEVMIDRNIIQFRVLNPQEQAEV